MLLRFPLQINECNTRFAGPHNLTGFYGMHWKKKMVITHNRMLIIIIFLTSASWRIFFLLNGIKTISHSSTSKQIRLIFHNKTFHLYFHLGWNIYIINIFRNKKKIAIEAILYDIESLATKSLTTQFESAAPICYLTHILLSWQRVRELAQLI